MEGLIGRQGKVIEKPNWKYKTAYEYLAEMIFSHDSIDGETRAEVSERLDEIFGPKRKC